MAQKKKKNNPGSELGLHIWLWAWAVPCCIAGLPTIFRGAAAVSRLAEYMPLRGALAGVGFILSSIPVLLVAFAPILIFGLGRSIVERRRKQKG